MYAKSWIFKGLCLAILVLLSSSNPEDATYGFPLDTHRALSGTFGELRSNHYHSGIDLKTGGKSGEVVRAIEDGYVYRINVSPFGYGNAIYLRHADGNFSVYGHLSRFNQQVEAFLRNKQYSSKKFAQDLYLGQDEIRVAKGQVIAWSGNSGSSMGPHLHFEIRDPQERILNPLRWYRYQIADSRPPILQTIGFEPVDIGSRVNGTFDKLTLTPSGADGNYAITPIIKLRGRVGVEYQAYDLLNAASNHCGINYARLYLDGQLIHEFALERYAFDEKRFINVHFDYGYYQSVNKKMQRAYVEPGNRFPGNRPLIDQGYLLLEDDQVHDLKLELTDFHGNETELRARVQRDNQPANFPSAPTYYSQPEVSYEIKRNVLILTATKAHASYRGGLVMESIYGDLSRIMPAYMTGEKMVFLLALDRYRYPKVIKDEIGKWQHTFHLADELLPFQNNMIEYGAMKLFVPYRSMFERVPLEIVSVPGPSTSKSYAYRIGNAKVPVFEAFLVSIQAPENWQGGPLVVARKDGDKWKYMGATVGEEGEIYGSSMEFGEFCLMEDAQAPGIRPINFTNNGTLSASANRLTIALSDNFSEIDHETIYGTIDGNWVLFEYDYRPGHITYTWDQRPTAGWHDVEIAVRDQAGNLATQRFKLKF